MTWTTPRTWVSSEVVTAAICNTHIRDNLLALSDRIQVVRKSADETIISNATPQNDDELKFTAVAGQTYIFDIDLMIVTSSAAIDLALQFTFPTGTLTYDVIAEDPAATTSIANVLMSTITAATSGGTPVTVGAISGNTHVRIQGSFLCTTGGTVQLQWAQGASTATNLTVKAGSWLQALRAVA